MRTGFTLLELLVAIVVLSVGALSLAATAGLVAAHVGDGARFTAAAYFARSVLDSLGTRPCASLASGMETRPEASADWIVAAEPRSASVQVTVSFHTRRGLRRHTIAARVPCL